VPPAPLQLNRRKKAKKKNAGAYLMVASKIGIT
jgi:hypothetical protein